MVVGNRIATPQHATGICSVMLQEDIPLDISTNCLLHEFHPHPLEQLEAHTNLPSAKGITRHSVA